MPNNNPSTPHSWWAFRILGVAMDRARSGLTRSIGQDVARLVRAASWYLVQGDHTPSAT